MRQKTSKKKKGLSRINALSTGSTLLNLACTDTTWAGFMCGHFYFLVGDSISGKTFLSLTCFAEASINKHFHNHRLIFDNVEGGALMDIRRFFGKGVFERMEPPTKKKGVAVYSSTIEEFYFNVEGAIQDGRPFIYVLDSMDSLSSKDEADKFKKSRDAHHKGKEISGSFGDGKAKKNSANLRRLLTPLSKSGSILIIINQTRDNLGFGFEKKARSGGRALRFYSCIELWSSVIGKIKKMVKGKPRQLGIKCKIQIKKNRIVGKEREIIIPIYHSLGIDDVGSCVDYLIDEGHWSKNKKGKITATEFDFCDGYEKLIKHITSNDMEKDLIDIVDEVWHEIEDACVVKNRKKRYE